MGSALDNAIATERWQALQKLEAAFQQSDTNMFFTYNGDTYRSVGVNPDGTMRVINQTTGAVTTLDPIDVYNSAQIASGGATVSHPSIIPRVQNGGPPMGSAMMQQIGFYSGLAPLTKELLQVLLQKLPLSVLNSAPGLFGKLLNVIHFLNNPYVAAVLGGLGAVLGAYGAFTGVQSFYKNPTAGGVLNIGMSAFGVATGLNMAFGQSMFAAGGFFAAGAVVSASFEFAGINDLILHGFSVKGFLSAGLGFLGAAAFTNLMIGAAAFGPLGLAVAAAVAIFAVIWSLLHRPPPEQIAAQNLTQALNPVVWVQGPLIVVAVGTVAMLMGWARTQTPPAMASLTVPAYYVNRVLASQGVPGIDLKSKTPSVIVEPGSGRVVIVSPNGSDSHGNALVKLETYNVAKNLQFISSPNTPPQGSYIPFFMMVNGSLSTKPNPDLMNAMEIQTKMLQAALSGTLLTHDALNAINIAAAANKYGVSPGN